MGKTYQCPDCGGTEIVWDRGLRKTVCPKDRTPVDSYKIASLESIHPTIKKKTAESKKTTQKKTLKGKTTTKKTKRKKKSS